MSDMDHCKLSVSTFSRWGMFDRWFFGDFLKYSKNNLVSEKPELVIETFNQETKVQNPVVLNRGPHPSLRKKNLKDAAMFTYCEKSDRPILDLQVSSYHHLIHGLSPFELMGLMLNEKVLLQYFLRSFNYL